MKIRTSSLRASGLKSAPTAKSQITALKRALSAGIRRVGKSPKGTAEVVVTTTYVGKSGEILAIIHGYPPIPPSWLVREGF
jgi:hypothetical protein